MLQASRSGLPPAPAASAADLVLIGRGPIDGLQGASTPQAPIRPSGALGALHARLCRCRDPDRSAGGALQAAVVGRVSQRRKSSAFGLSSFWNCVHTRWFGSRARLTIRRSKGGRGGSAPPPIGGYGVRRATTTNHPNELLPSRRPTALVNGWENPGRTRAARPARVRPPRPTIWRTAGSSGCWSQPPTRW
jgi:hypothetical protein